MLNRRTVRTALWNPVVVNVGDVGYLHPNTRTFTTLFNAFKPFHVPFESQISIPSILGFGDPILKHSKIATQKSRKLFRTFTYKLEMEEGKPLAHCFCESPDWHYLEETKPPEAWFKASADSIIKIHGEKHGIAKEDLFLVVGTLQASRYSLFVSCNHPAGSVSRGLCVSRNRSNEVCRRSNSLPTLARRIALGEVSRSKTPRSCPQRITTTISWRLEFRRCRRRRRLCFWRR